MLYAFVYAVLVAVAVANFCVAWWLGLRRPSGLVLAAVLGGLIPGAWLYSASAALQPTGSAGHLVRGAAAGATIGLLVGALALWIARRLRTSGRRSVQDTGERPSLGEKP